MLAAMSNTRKRLPVILLNEQGRVRELRRNTEPDVLNLDFYTHCSAVDHVRFHLILRM